MAQSNPEHSLTIVIVGDSFVGKTAIMERFINDGFTCSYTSTIYDMKFKKFDFHGKLLLIRIVDTPGQERFKTVNYQPFRGADGVIICFDHTDKYSFSNIKYYIDQIERYAPKTIVKIIVGNKCDEFSKTEIDFATASAFSEDINIPYFECSAKYCININEIFQNMITLCLTEIMDKQSSSNADTMNKIPTQSVKEKNNKNCNFQ